jgi:hypothetical protein
MALTTTSKTIAGLSIASDACEGTPAIFRAIAMVSNNAPFTYI